MATLIVFSGLPGTGKSKLAETVGQNLNIPVFAKDWLEAALWRSGITRDANSGWASYELLSALAETQLRLNQSAILDSVAAVESIRKSWRDLAQNHHARFKVIETICSNQSIHRSRLNSRERNIPGWYELDWDEVERVRQRYEVWQANRLIVDALTPFDSNLRRVLDFLK